MRLQSRCVLAAGVLAVAGGVAGAQCTLPLLNSPPSVLVCGGNSVSLAAPQTGLPSGTTVRWYRGTTVLDDGGRLSGAATTTLTINPIAPEDLLEPFRCVYTTTCQTTGATLGVMVAQNAAWCSLAYQRVATGLSVPTCAVAPVDDYDRLFITLRGASQAASIRVLDLRTNTLQATPYLSLTGVSTTGEDGLLSIAFDPRFSENGYFYACYSNTQSDNVIARYRANPPYLTSSSADPASATIIAVFDQNGAIHNGGWIGFRPDDTQGYLYITVGDGGSSANAQNTTVPRGKVLRIDVDGPDNIPGNEDDADPVAGTAYRIPPDNPFASTDQFREILAYGLRNPWRCSFDRDTGDFYIGDVGSGTEEEISLIASNTPASPAINLGWPCFEGRRYVSTISGCNPAPANVTGPIFANGRNGGCAITGGFVYRGPLIPSLRGYYLFSDYCGGFLYALDVHDVQQGVISSPMPFSLGARMESQGAAVGNIPAMGQDADGEIYVMDSTSVYRIVDLGRVSHDCNANGVDDALDISRGVEGDCDGDGVPDSCDSPCCPACPADFDQDGGVTPNDIGAFFKEFEPGRPCGDVDMDGGITGADIAAFFVMYEAGGC